MSHDLIFPEHCSTNKLISESADVANFKTPYFNFLLLDHVYLKFAVFTSIPTDLLFSRFFDCTRKTLLTPEGYHCPVSIKHNAACSWYSKLAPWEGAKQAVQ